MKSTLFTICLILVTSQVFSSDTLLSSCSHSPVELEIKNSDGSVETIYPVNNYEYGSKEWQICNNLIKQYNKPNHSKNKLEELEEEVEVLKKRIETLENE